MAVNSNLDRIVTGHKVHYNSSAEGTRSVPAVEKAFSILEVLARSKSGLTLRELTQTCGLPKSSVHGIIVTLQRSGYLLRNRRTSRYLFARRLLSLANNALTALDLHELADPHIRKLASNTRLAVHVAVPEFNEAVIVAKSDYPFEQCASRYWIGKPIELHCTALGKALVIDWSDSRIDNLFMKNRFLRHNDNTIWTAKQLKEELVTIRRQGYSVDDEEDVLGFRSVGVPVRDGENNIIAAISVSGSSIEVVAENVTILARDLKDTAARLSEALAICLSG